MPEADCEGFMELLDDGTLRYDRFGETPVVIHQASVTPEELDDAIEVLLDPELMALLDRSEPPCVPPTDIFEAMTLVVAGVEHSNSTTACEDPPLSAARQTLQGLIDIYFPAP
jgi:hypothetical protein